ncbi:MAG: hypothetical protein JWP69_462 [Flaviaesturariibacter sp.]|nr:hypothetical protein [Flaviaesturariibacter sp.]
MNRLLLKLVLLLLHAFVNFVIISWLVNFDITGSWLTVAGFVLLVLALIVFFIRHLVSFYYFIKTKTR